MAMFLREWQKRRKTVSDEEEAENYERAFGKKELPGVDDDGKPEEKFPQTYELPGSTLIIERTPPGQLVDAVRKLRPQ